MPSANQPLAELDIVRTRRAFPDEGLPGGAMGTIVVVHVQPCLAYEVEFVDDEGDTLAMLPLRPEDL